MNTILFILFSTILLLLVFVVIRLYFVWWTISVKGYLMSKWYDDSSWIIPDATSYLYTNLYMWDYRSIHDNSYFGIG